MENEIYGNIELINLKYKLDKDQIKFIYECYQDYQARIFFSNDMYVKSFNEFIKEIKTKLIYKFNDLVIIKNLSNNNYIGFIYSYRYSANSGNIHTTVYIKPDSRNSIYFIQSCLGFYNYLFNSYSIRKVYCSVMEYNKISIKLLNDLGFKLEGTLLKHKYLNGNYYNIEIYALYREQFLKIKEKFKKWIKNG